MSDIENGAAELDQDDELDRGFVYTIGVTALGPCRPDEAPDREPGVLGFDSRSPHVVTLTLGTGNRQISYVADLESLTTLDEREQGLNEVNGISYLPVHFRNHPLTINREFQLPARETHRLIVDVQAVLAVLDL